MLTKIYHHLIRIIPKESAVKIKMGTNILVIRFRADKHVCRAILHTGYQNTKISYHFSVVIGLGGQVYDVYKFLYQTWMNV